MRLSLPVSLGLLATLVYLSSVSGRALELKEVESPCPTDKCPPLTHRALVRPLDARVDIFFGDEVPPHEGDPTSGDHASGDASGGSSGGDPGSSGDPGLLELGGSTGPSTGGDRTISLPYDQYQSRGTNAQNDLDQAIQAHKPDVIRPDISGGYKAWFDGEIHSMDDTCDELTAVFSDTDVSLNPATKYTVREWASVKSPPGDADLVNWSLYNKDENSIVVKSMDSSLDGLPEGDPRKLTASELIWQSWKGVAGDGRANLRIIVQEDINNKGTLDTITAAYARNGLDSTKAKGNFALDGQDGNRNDAFTALLGTDNVRPTVYMLTDHHQELGDKAVQRIFTYPPGYGNGPTSAWTVVIIIW